MACLLIVGFFPSFRRSLISQRDHQFEWVALHKRLPLLDLVVLNVRWIMDSTVLEHITVRMSNYWFDRKTHQLKKPLLGRLPPTVSTTPTQQPKRSFYSSLARHLQAGFRHLSLFLLFFDLYCITFTFHYMTLHYIVLY
jgi:hypothetical protein